MEHEFTHTTLRDYVRVLCRHFTVILIATLTVIGTVIIGLLIKTPMYESQAKLLISAEKQVESPYYREMLGSRNAELTLTQSQIVKSERVLSRAVQAIALHKRPLDHEAEYASALKKKIIAHRVKGIEEKLADVPEENRDSYYLLMTVENLKETITVEPLRDTNIFVIKVRDHSPLVAQVLANVISRSYVIYDLEQQLNELELKYGEKHPSVKQLLDNIQTMKETLHGRPLPDLSALGTASVKIIEQANRPLEPAGTPEVLTLILACVMGPFLGIMLAFVFEYMDHTFKTPADVESLGGLTFLGSIPKKRFRGTALFANKKAPPRSSFARAVQKVADQLYLMITDGELKSVLIASALPGEGTSTVIANLAHLFATKHKKQVLVIDGNFRAPAIAQKFKIPASHKAGLADVIEGRLPFEDAVYTAQENLSVLTSGKTELNAISLLDSQKMRQILSWAHEHYDIILIDVAPMRDYKDAYVIAGYVNALALLISEGITRRQIVKNALAPLADSDVKILGAILNHRTFPIPGFLYNIT
jgi:capsular exopolysaccharide synthesis family protein